MNDMAKTWKSPNSQVDKNDGALSSQEETQPANVEPAIQSNVIDSYASRWERQRIDQIKNRRLSMG